MTATDSSQQWYVKALQQCPYVQKIVHQCPWMQNQITSCPFLSKVQSGESTDNTLQARQPTSSDLVQGGSMDPGQQQPTQTSSAPAPQPEESPKTDDNQRSPQKQEQPKPTLHYVYSGGRRHLA